MPKRIYHAAIYCRLSREDGDKLESNSVASQRAICEDFIVRQEDIELAMEPFVDDGYSGVSFERPGFRRLEDEVRSGRIDCIICKDLSRFSRNYIDGGRYLEKIFPQLGVRFIAINDAYDSLTGDPHSDSFIIPFKNLINDSYCKDISVKVRSSLGTKQKNGEFVGAFAPYGYRKAEGDKNSLVVDEEVREVVQTIFSMYKDGFGIGRIADRLNQMGVRSPMEHKRAQGLHFDTVFKRGETAQWTYKAIRRILTNEVYIGVMAQGKRGRPNHKVRVVQNKDESDWVKVENTHEAIISHADFTQVQEMLKRDSRCASGSTEVYPLSGFLFCGDCGRSMVRKSVSSKSKKYLYYVCSGSRRTHDCTQHSISAAELESKVFRAIHDQIELVIDLGRALELIRGLPNQDRAVLNYEAQTVKLEEEGYAFAKRNYDEQYAELSRCRDEAVQRRARFQEAMSADNKWIMLMRSISTAETLSQELVDEAVELVKVHEDGAIELVLKYGDIYALTLESIRDVQEAM